MKSKTLMKSKTFHGQGSSHDPRISRDREPGRLTENGEKDDDEIEHIPRLLEVVEPQRDELHQELHREDIDEEIVDKVEHVLLVLWLGVELEGHGRHVEQDDDHDADVKGLVGGELEEEHLPFVLRTRQGKE